MICSKPRDRSPRWMAPPTRPVWPARYMRVWVSIVPPLPGGAYQWYRLEVADVVGSPPYDFSTSSTRNIKELPM
jgi:hypothetical protein